KGKFLSGGNNPIYMLAFANICGNLIQVTIYAFYFGPICMMQDFLFPGGKNNFFPGFLTYLTHGQWNQDLFIHDATFFNRLIMIVYPKAKFLFSRKATIGIIIFVYVFGYLTSWFSDYYLSCFKFYLYYGSYSYTFLDTEYNVANIFVDTPVNFIASGIAVANYIIIYIYVRISNRKMSHVIDKSIQQIRKNQEIKYVFQFALCTCFCIAMWVSFRIFSVLGIPPSPLYLILTTFRVLHSSMNSIVFLVFNKDVRKQFRRHILRQDVKESISTKNISTLSRSRTLMRIIL
ncbi:hypothetical protein FO519_009583, partial [Halicephalobus sp. NKZ332]